MLVLCVGGLSAVTAQVRCIDAAREAARLAARGDEESSRAAVRAIAPGGADLRVQRDGDFVVATVSVAAPLLPGITVGAVSAALLEPGD